MFAERTADFTSLAYFEIASPTQTTAFLYRSQVLVLNECRR